MNLITKKLASCVLLLFIVSYTMFSQEGCDQPAPMDIWVTEATTTSIAIEWTPVVNVAEYLVTVIEVVSGDPIETEVVDHTNYEAQQLMPGAEYEFHVTSLCDNGASGGTGVLLAETNIIIVDIVMHLDCHPTHNNPTPTQGPSLYIAGNPQDFQFSPTNVIRFDGNVLGGTNAADFEFVFSFNPNTFQLIGGTSSVLSSLLQIIPNTGSGDGMIQYKSNGNWYELGSFKPIYNAAGSRIEITWKQDVNVSHTNCSSVIFGRWPGDEGGEEEEEDDQHLVGAQMAPNPAHDHVLIKVSEETPVRIYDLQGRIWADLYLEPGQESNLDISPWPNGMYVLQYLMDGQPITIQLIKN